MGKGSKGPDPGRLKPLQDMRPLVTRKQLEQVKGMFAYYSKWIRDFSTKLKPLSEADRFPISGLAAEAFEGLKKDLENVALGAVDEDRPFVVETDASDVAISASLNQGGRPVAFFSKSLHGSQLGYPAERRKRWQ